MAEPLHKDETVTALTCALLELIRERTQVEYPFSQELIHDVKEKAGIRTNKKVAITLWPEIYREVVHEKMWVYENAISRHRGGQHKDKKILKLTGEGKQHLNYLNGKPKLVTYAVLKHNQGALRRKMAAKLIELVRDHYQRNGPPGLPLGEARLKVAKVFGFNDFERVTVFGPIANQAIRTKEGIAKDEKGHHYVPQDAPEAVIKKRKKPAKAKKEGEITQEAREQKKQSSAMPAERPDNVELTYTLGADGKERLSVSGDAKLVIDYDNPGKMVIEDGTGQKWEFVKKWTPVAALIGFLVSRGWMS